MTDDARFDRLENKIDKLTDAVTQIARVEEKILASNHRLGAVENKIEQLSDDVDKIAETVRSTQGIARFADKLFWLGLGTLISVTIYSLGIRP